jgi:hypothetical protein
MGYYKNLEIGNQVEEGDRTLTRRQLKNHRRETYRAPKHFVVKNSDMFAILALPVVGIALGFVIGLLVP